MTTETTPKPLSKQRKLWLIVIYTVLVGWLLAAPVFAVLLLSANQPIPLLQNHVWLFGIILIISVLLWIGIFRFIYETLFDMAEKRWPTAKLIREIFRFIGKMIWTWHRPRAALSCILQSGFG